MRFELIKRRWLLLFLAAFGMFVSLDTRAADISRAGWKVKFVDSQELVGENAPATNAIDGNTGTFWHTQWLNASPPPPHELQIDLGAAYAVDGFRYLPRQDGSQNGWVKDYQFYVSTDGTTWGTPVATGTFQKNATQKSVSFAAKTGRYVRFVALSEVNGKPWTSAAEIDVTGTASSAALPPDGRIVTPSWNIKIGVGSKVNFLGSGTDLSNSTLSYNWNFGDPSIAPSTLQNPVVKFNNPGTYTVTLRVTNAAGLSDPSPTTRSVNVVNGTTGSLIPDENWSFVFVDSQELVGENAPATNAFDRDPFSFWHTQWLNASPPPPHEVQINLGRSYTLDSLFYLPRQDGALNGTVKNFEFYVSADGKNWGSPVATGAFATSTAEKKAAFTAPVTGQFVRFRALSEVNGKPWTSMAELNVQGRFPVGDYYVAIGDSITWGFGDTISSDDFSSDGTNGGGGFEPVLNNLLTAYRGYPQNISNEGVQGTVSADGLAWLPTVMARHPDAQRYLVMFGMNDARPWLPVPSGLGLHPGDPGYPGTYKDNMQRIINAVNTTGRQALLSKVNIALGSSATGPQYTNPDTGARNILIKQYNQVIDELVGDSANHITVTPPDLYSFFAVNAATQYFDNIHPNGQGYRSIAQLWFTALTQ